MKIGFDYIGVATPFYCHDGKGNFLFHKRSNKCRDEQMRWDTGSGKHEKNTRLHENVLKEIREEYGCSGEIQEWLPAHDILKEVGGIKSHWLVVPAFVLVDPKEVVIGEPDKMLELGWFTLDNLPEPLHTGFAYTLKTYRDYFRKYE